MQNENFDDTTNPKKNHKSMILCQNECATNVIITNTKMNTFLNQQCQKLTQKRVYYITNNKGSIIKPGR